MKRILSKVHELASWHYKETADISEFTRTTKSMHFYDSIVVLERGVVIEPFSFFKGERFLPKSTVPGFGERIVRRITPLIGFVRNNPVLYRLIQRVRRRGGSRE